jgi:hypothetical protein
MLMVIGCSSGVCVRGGQFRVTQCKGLLRAGVVRATFVAALCADRIVPRHALLVVAGVSISFMCEFCRAMSGAYALEGCCCGVPRRTAVACV